MEPPPPPDSTAVTDATADTGALDPVLPAQSEVEAPPQLQQEPPTVGDLEDAAAADSGALPIDPALTQSTPEGTDASRSHKRVLPWVAVNRPQEPDEEVVVAPPAKKPRPPPKPRGRKKTTATTETQEDIGEGGAEGSETQPVPKRPSAKARGKRKADATTVQDGAEESAPAPAKRARKPRKAKNQEGAANAGSADGEGQEQAEEGGEPVVRRKPRQPRRRKPVMEREGVDPENPVEPKRKGRPPREPTPSDAEDQEIDPDITFMDSIASRNIRVGKLSDREKAMREIDWVAVRQRQREEDARPITTREARDAAEQVMIEEAPHAEGPQFQIVDGQIKLVHGSTMVDREAEADREIENYEVVEERDLTTRITSRSFLKNNKRFPNDFILPGQGKRWTTDDTDLFYQGLQHFGTDFQMISHMFPGSTRRSIKLKFTREEREDPQRVREALLGQSTISTHWKDFIDVSQMEEEKFADAEKIKQEMAEHEAEMREKIAAARAETEERKRQQREAGLLDDEEGNDPNKENGKGKKKRKGKEKQVTFQEEVGVEIVGNVDDDDTWGQE
jgi:transcription factor TFIIIB component B''